MENQPDFIIKLAFDAWLVQVNYASKLFEGLSDEQLQQQVAPGRNTGVYLLGHLVAVHDAMIPLLGVGERLYPEYEELFIKQPDNSGQPKPSTEVLRHAWTEVNKYLNNRLAGLHAAVSAEDFTTQPYRNKFNVLLSRTAHLANHIGQLIFLKNS
jgi:DinB superfamily